MGTRPETTVVSAAALVQGIALVTFPAAFHPDGVDNAVLTLNALLGLGTPWRPSSSPCRPWSPAP